MNIEIQYKDDPTATYRGYRRQALYCLYRLFEDGLPEGSVVQPEGNEDLAILNPAGELVEIAQVKDYTDDLKVSHFKGSFYRRISEHCEPDSAVRVKIISFGTFGNELQKAFDNEAETPTRPFKTLTKDRKKTGPWLTDEEAKAVFSHVKIEQVNEDELTQAVIEKIKATGTGGNPEAAFENLMWLKWTPFAGPFWS